MDNNEKGAVAEQLIAELCEDAFVADFCFKNPYGPDNKEICDLLVKVRNTVIIWQIKNLKLRKKDGQFKASEITKAISQCRGAKRKLTRLGEIELTNIQGEKKKIDLSEVQEYYLVAAIEGGQQLIGDYYDSETDDKVHIFYETFTRIATKHLNTISDFTKYLKDKQSFFENTNVILSGGEENLLAYYMKNARTFGELEKATHVFFDDEDHWETLENHEDFKAKLEADKWSQGWDGLIEKKRQATGTDGADKGPDKFLATMTQHTRLERRSLSKIFFDAAVEATKLGKGYVYRRYVPCENVTYVFAFMGDDDTPKRSRQNMLYAACIVARKKIPINDMVIGIVTEKDMVKTPTCSYDWVLLDINDEDFEKEFSAVADEYAEKLQMLKNPKVAMTNAKEYPNQAD